MKVASLPEQPAKSSENGNLYCVNYGLFRGIQTVQDRTLTSDQPVDPAISEPEPVEARAGDPVTSEEEKDCSHWYGSAASTLIILSSSLNKIRIGGLVKHGEDGVGTVCRSVWLLVLW